MTKADYYAAARKARKMARRADQQRKALDRVSVSLASFYTRDTVEALARESLSSKALMQALQAGWL